MEGAPNVLAWLAIVLCLPVSVALTSVWRPAVAVPLILLAGQMFLPPVITLDAPLFPALGKEHLVPLGALIGCFFFRRRILKGAKPFRGYDLFIVLRLIGLFGTYMTNGDPIKIGPITLPGLSLYDFITSAIKEILFWWPPFFLGRTVIRTSKDLRTLFVILAGAGLLYTFFEFIEIVFSPNLNRWIYGFHPSRFLMSIRAGGYRPMVFMRHGINVAFFTAVMILAATTLGRIKGRVFGIKGWVIALYMSFVLVLCHSLGALIYAAACAPLLWFGRPRTQAKVAAVIALLAFSYPVARATGLVPVEQINLFTAQKFGEDRSASLALRLSEEELLMGRALERITFGWGGYSRSFRHDPTTGVSTSITDGAWASEVGTNGIFGFVSLFGMLLYPAWRSRAALRKLVGRDERAMAACLGLIAAIYGVELIPNSSIDPYLTFLVGVLAGLDARGLEPEPVPVWAGARPAHPEGARTSVA